MPLPGILLFCSSPIQISCKLSKLTRFDMDMLCNDEILALNQDPFGVQQIKMQELCAENHRIRSHTRPTEDGFAAAFFNLGEVSASGKLSLDRAYRVRDLWTREDLGEFDGSFEVRLEPHTVRVVRFVR